MDNIVNGYEYNEDKTIRTKYSVERIFSSERGFIGFVWDVEYLNRASSKWQSVGSRWLINTDDIIDIIENGFNTFPEIR